MNVSRRLWLLLVVTLVVTLSSFWVKNKRQSQSSLVLAPRAAVAETSARAGQADGEADNPAHMWERKPMPAAGVDAMGSGHWKLPPAPVPAAGTPEVPGQVMAPTPTPKPTAPPLPFVYLGQYGDGTKTVVYLDQQGKSLAVGRGEQIEGNYRVDAISNTAVVFTYLPLKEKQTLPLGGNP